MRCLTLLAALLSVAAAPAWPATLFVSRYDHSATLLANRNILICGGVIDSAGTVTNTCQISLEDRDDYLNAPNMSVARASHTATLLPDGRVLIAGGRNAGGPLSSAELYNPVTNSWANASNSLSGARLNHTATLLETGKVLICGGHNLTTALSSCDLFDPASNSFTNTYTMQAARSAHTATLLRNGRVFLAGGYDPSIAPPFTRYLVTVDIFDPANPTQFLSKALSVARAHHSATMLGNGKVLIAGGMNDRDINGNQGILDTTELYDPIADTLTPQAAMLTRLRNHAAALQTDGTVRLIGGLGNLTTSYEASYTSVLEAGSFVGGTFSGKLSTVTINTGNLVLPLDISLNRPVNGVIQNGDVYFSCPTIRLAEGEIYFRPGNPSNNNSGLRVSLAGNEVVNGLIAHTTVAINMQGEYYNYNASLSPDAFVITQGTAVITGGVLSSSNPLKNLGYSSTFISNVADSGGMIIRGFSPRFIGANISSGIYTVTNARLNLISSYTITLDQAYFTIPNPTPIVSDGLGGARTQPFDVRISSVVQGTIEFDGEDNSFGGNTSLFINQNMSNVTGLMRFVTDRIDLEGATFQSDVATIVVRSMMFQDVEKYAPNTNAWSFDEYDSLPRYNHTATLTSDGDIRIHGGRSCNPTFLNVHCASEVPQGQTTSVPPLPAWSQFSGGSNMVSGPRAHHTATLLPDGKILVAGGTNGPSILNTAELFDPESNTFESTGRMHSVRDLHTATLLPNGRVLVSGGFSTNALSTGAINQAEIYYPDTRLWLPTELMISSRSNHTATLLADGNVLVAGGSAYGAYPTSVEIFYSTSSTWRRAADNLPLGGRALHTATLLNNGKVLVVGGVNATGVLGSVLLFDPVAGTWSDAGAADLPAGVRAHSHSATLLQDGRVLVSGGNDEYGELNLSIIYDPAANSWTQTTDATLGGNSLTSARFGHTTTLLPNGLVAVVGGAQSGGASSLNLVETFNVGGSTWTAGGKMASRRSFHSATLADNGFLYAIGGYDSVNYLSSVERVYMGLPTDANTTGAPPSPRLPVIGGVDRTVFDRGETLTSTGTNFHGITEASGGGSGPMNSSQQSPRLVLQSIGGEEGGSSYLLDLSTAQLSPWTLSNTSLTVTLPSVAGQLPYGWYHLRVGANAQYSDSVLVQAGPPKPASPVSNITGVAQSTTAILWTWDRASGSFDGYNVYSATTGVFLTTMPVVAVSPFISSFTQTNLIPNASCQIQVAPFRLSGDGPLSVSATFFTLANPAANLSISEVKSNSLLLSWSANSNRQGTTYEISQSTDNFLTVSTPVPASLNFQATFYTVAPLADNTTFYFRVRAFNGASIPAAFSNVVSTRTSSTVFGLQATPQTTSIQWGWLDPGGVINYRVYNATTGALLATPVSNVFNQTGLSTNTAYALQVSAVTGAGEGPLSDSVTAYTLAATPLPAFPAVTNLTTGSFRVNWLANDNPPGTTYIAEISSTDFVVSKTTNITTALQANFGNLAAPAEIWQIRVKALNEDDIASSPLVIGSTPTLARTPVNLAVDDTSPSSIEVSWDNDGNASSATYQVTYSSDGFVGHNAVAVPFSLGFNGSEATITGLLSSTTYEIRVAARNSVGKETTFSNTVSTRTANGGVALGSLAGVLSAGANNVISGSIGSVPPRTILLQSPVGAFPSDVTLTISSFNVAGNTLCSNPSAIGLQITANPPLQPNKNIFLTFSYTAAEIGALPASRLVLARHEPSLGKCVPLPTTVNTANQTITASLNHFSNFQVVAVSPAAAVSTARIFPNPWYAGQTGQVTFHQLPAFTKVRIFTLKGELVNELSANASGLVSWDGVNRGGRRVASGVYLVVFEDGGAKKILKLAVIQ